MVSATRHIIIVLRHQNQMFHENVTGLYTVRISLKLSAIHSETIFSMLVFLAVLDFPGGSDVKNPSASAGDVGSIPGSGRSLEKEMALTPVFLPEQSHGQRSLVVNSLWGWKESDTT